MNVTLKIQIYIITTKEVTNIAPTVENEDPTVGNLWEEPSLLMRRAIINDLR